ncbi:MAG TPA: ABC transporter permease [Polyangiaceae bacterium]|nr:ABC transporter permease [Polyangiaceae bacterium]
MNDLALLMGASIDSGTALALAGLGLLINERAGVVNLGAEGLMLVAAVTGFATAVHTGSTAAALLVGGIAAAALALCFGLLVVGLNTNQYATGLALSLFGSGFSAFIGLGYTQESLAQRLGGKASSTWFAGLAELPGVGPVLFGHHPMAYGAVALSALVAWFLFRTRAGLALRAIGERPEVAHALGYPVRRIRLVAVTAGGALCGLAGAYVSVIYTPLWVEGMIAGRGWIALALTSFATWRPARVLLGAYLFGGVTMLQLHLQGRGVNLPVQLLTSLPYVSTILVLVLIARRPSWIRANMPASLGKPFHPHA